MVDERPASESLTTIAPLQLRFEDISVHSPGVFAKSEAMQTLRDAPSGVGFRAALKELNQTEESFAKILSQAREKALGNSDGDLELIKAHIKRLKFGTIELSTEQAFLKAVLESRQLPKDAPTESEGFKALQQRLKSLTSENERRVEEMERQIAALGDEYETFRVEHRALTEVVEELETLEAEAATAAWEAQAGDASVTAADREKSKDELQRELESLDVELREVNVRLSENQMAASKLKEQLAPDESAIEQINAQAKYLIGISKAAAREAQMSAQIAEAQEAVREQTKLLVTLQGVEILAIEENALVLKIHTHLPSTPEFAMEGSTPRGPSSTTHTVTLHLVKDSARLAGATLEPSDTPILDIIEEAAGMPVLARALAEIRLRIAATAQRAEALAAAAARTALRWSSGESLVRAALPNGAVAVLDVPFEWPTRGANISLINVEMVPPQAAQLAVTRLMTTNLNYVGEALEAVTEALKNQS
ncbi:unnamed product [Ostreococcus tauri]|uniref:Unnamed product n=1 Tax=Ostreococcus tauri TaxID=70448 RepID=A0A090M8G0_OSTTA|nr:unnamed product [Ostreococcus tauri]OUS48441.1 hypothetical protein BE221DRAFT_203591 [Ostreococcus tauri]CEF98374.1 unnamed product [Ostreococcus tauri]|eukprot:XP_022839231.1 unnamed product [Ostreococcus tauri]